MNGSYGPSLHLRVQSAEPDKTRILKEAAITLAECIEEKLYEKLGKKQVKEAAIRIDLDEDWPYVFTIDVSVKSSETPGDLEELLYNVLDECIDSIAGLLRDKGLEILY